MLIIIFLIALTTIWFIGRYYQWHATYWDRKGIKSPPSRLFYGHLGQLGDHLHPPPLQTLKWTKEYGKVYGIYEGIRKVLVVSDPDMLQELFHKKFEKFYARKLHLLLPDMSKEPRAHVFAAEGSRWKRLRTLTAPTFTTNSLKKIHGTVEDSVLCLLELMKKHVDSGKGFNILSFYGEYTMDVICRIAMGQDESRMFHNPLVNIIQKHFLSPIDNPFTTVVNGLPYIPEFILGLIRKAAAFRGKTTAPVFDIIEKAVFERKEQRRLKLERGEDIGEPVDFIDLFLDAEAPDMQLDSSNGIDRAHMKVEKNLTTQEVIAQCFVFLLAGFDTTANSLTYASFLLSKHPDKMRRLQKELDEHCPGSDMPFDSLHKLKYMDCVVKESLRMYPLAATANSRKCTKETTLGGITIEEGVYVRADTFSVHYDKDIWGKDADEFNPERWEDGAVRHPLSWIPFGSGPRQCIGMRLAYLEEKLALGHILKNYDIVAGPESEKELHLIGGLTTSPERVTVYLRSRTI